MTTRTQRHHRWLGPGLSIALTIVALFFAFHGIDAHVFERLLATQDRGLLAAAAVFILLQIVLAAERWRAILSVLTRGQTPSFLSVQAVFYASIFFNSLPLGTLGGDVARVWLARRFALSVKQLVMSVLIDRGMAVAALVVLACLTLPTIAHPYARAGWLGSAAVLAAGAAGFLLLRIIERVLGRWRHRSFVYLLLRATEELRYLKHRDGVIGLCFAVLSATSAAIAGYCIARSLGIDVAPLNMIAIMSMVTLVVALPISTAGWGVREISLVTLLGVLGVDRTPALLMSVEFGLLGTLLNLPGGLAWLKLAGSLRSHSSPINKQGYDFRPH